MSKIAQTPAMYPVQVDGSEDFEARERDNVTARAIVCGDILREHFCLPQDVSAIWLIAYDAPTDYSLKVILKGRRTTWVSCEIAPGEYEFFVYEMDQYLVKQLKLKYNEPKTFHIECEYRE